MADVAVRAVGLTKHFGAANAPVVALGGVSVEVRRGERVALLGRSGLGKSTLLNLLGGLDRPTAGAVVVEGLDLAGMSGSQRAAYRLSTVGMIFQAYNLIQARTALENVELPMIFAGRPRKERREAATRALEAVGLGHRLGHKPSELSGGEMQRAAIARALVNRPKILLADEPTGNLDTSTAGEVLDLLMAYLRAHGTTLIMVTHDEDLAAQCADRVLRMRDGRFVDQPGG